MRPLLRAAAALAALLLLLLLLLPRRSEVRREALVDAPPAVVLGALGELEHAPTWATWTPAREGALRVTAATEAGVWFEVAGPRRRRAAVQVSPDGAGTRVVWSDVKHYEAGALGRLAGLLRERRVGPELEASLSGLRGACE